jgi:catechol 2,3-dioxygenase-like lactoylglutathione lyase family enzyme
MLAEGMGMWEPAELSATTVGHRDARGSLASANRLRRAMPSRGIHHVDLTVADVERSLAFYLDLLGPLGWEESARYASYRGTEEVVYLTDAVTGFRESGTGFSMLGIRPADGGAHRYYGVGIEHFAIEVDRREEVDEAHARCLASGANVHFPPEEDSDVPGYYAFFAFDPDGIRVEVFCWPR